MILYPTTISEYPLGPIIQGCTDDAIISAVRSVSGLMINVLKFDPLCTVNHCPFLSPDEPQEFEKKFRAKKGVLLSDQLSFPQISQTLLSRLKRSGRVDFPELQLRLVFNRSDLSTN